MYPCAFPARAKLLPQLPGLTNLFLDNPPSLRRRHFPGLRTSAFDLGFSLLGTLMYAFPDVRATITHPTVHECADQIPGSPLVFLRRMRAKGRTLQAMDPLQLAQHDGAPTEWARVIWFGDRPMPQCTYVTDLQTAEPMVYFHLAATSHLPRSTRPTRDLIGGSYATLETLLRMIQTGESWPDLISMAPLGSRL